VNLPARSPRSSRIEYPARRRVDPDQHQKFVPPFCPRKGCSFHRHPPADRRWYWRWGFFSDRIFGRVQRFRCKCCSRCFSTQTFSVHYFIKRMIDLRGLVQLIVSAASVRASARMLCCSTGSVGNRTDRLMRQAIVTLSDITSEACRGEELCADGFRTFCVSQYFPCDIAILVGSSSDTVYGLDYALLRRSGAMSERQKQVRAKLDSRVTFDRRASEKSFSRILDIAMRLWAGGGGGVLSTDKHPAYRAAWNAHPHMQHLQARGWARHRRVSSRKPRTAANPLRAVNYIDREIRKDRADHHRETVCFARNVPRMLGRLVIYFVMHNLVKKRRIRGSRSPSPLESLHDSHALHAGITADRQANMAVGLLTHRRFLSRELLSPFHRTMWMKRVPTPLKRNPERVPKYALA